MSNLSPIDGIGPDEIGADALVRLCQGGVTEVILALDSTVEGRPPVIFLPRALVRPAYRCRESRTVSRWVARLNTLMEARFFTRFPDESQFELHMDQ